MKKEILNEIDELIFMMRFLKVTLNLIKNNVDKNDK